MEASNQCDTAQDIRKCAEITVGGYLIQSPALIPSCIMALIIGVWASNVLKKKKLQSYYFYATAFKLTGIMMTAALFYACLLNYIEQKFPLVSQILHVVNSGLTGTIAIAYLFSGLNDINIIGDKQKCPRIFFYIITICYFSVWIYGIGHFNQQKLQKYLYDDVVMVGCGGWVLIEMLLHVNIRNCKGITYFLLASLAGGIGYLSIIDFKISQYLCEKLSCFFAGSFLWFLVTPICQYLIYKYYMKTRTHREQSKLQSNSEENCQLALTNARKPVALIVNQELPILYNQPQQMIYFQQAQQPMEFVPLAQGQQNTILQQQGQQKGNNFSAHGQYFQFK